MAPGGRWAPASLEPLRLPIGCLRPVRVGPRGVRRPVSLRVDPAGPAGPRGLHVPPRYPGSCFTSCRRVARVRRWQCGSHVSCLGPAQPGLGLQRRPLPGHCPPPLAPPPRPRRSGAACRLSVSQAGSHTGRGSLPSAGLVEGWDGGGSTERGCDRLGALGRGLVLQVAAVAAGGGVFSGLLACRCLAGGGMSLLAPYPTCQRHSAL